MKHNSNLGHAELPLAGVKVLDFGHTVMAPTCGLILADLGATVVRIERLDGDPTRSLAGFGSGFFGYLNRNKESVAVDLKISEVVDTPNWVVSAFLPLAIFG